MGLNLSEVRKACEVVETLMSQDEFAYGNHSPKDGLIRLESALGHLVPDIPKILEIVEAAKRGLTQSNLFDGMDDWEAGYDKESIKLDECRKRFRELLRDVDIDDAPQ